MKISSVVLSTFVLFAIIISAADFFYTYKTTNTLMLDELGYHLQSVSESRADHFRTYLLASIENARGISFSRHITELAQAKNSNLQSNSSNYSVILDDAKDILADYVRAYPSLLKISILAKDGSVIYSTDESNIDISEGQEVLDVLSSEGIFIENIHWSKGFDVPCMDIGYPILDKAGNLVGAVLIDVSINELYSISTDNTGMLETGEIYFLNKDRLMISPSRFLKDTFLSQKVDNVNVDRCFAEAALDENIREKGARQIILYSNYQGNKVFGTYTYVPETGWCLIAEVRQDEISSKVFNELSSSYVYAFIIMFFFIIIFSVMLTTLVSLPIQRVTKKIDLISKGQIDITMGRSNILEYQKLIDSLNRILASLKIAVLKVGVRKEELGLGQVIEAKKKAEETVVKRTEQLERFAKLATGREEKMIELKKRVADLEKELERKRR